LKKFVNKILLAYRWIPTITKEQLIFNFPKPIGFIMICMIKLILLLPNRLIVLLLPKRYCALFANIAMNDFNDTKALPFVIKAQSLPRSRKLAIHYELHIAERTKKIENPISKAFTVESLIDGRFDSTLSWGFWTLSHSRYQKMLTKAKLFLENETLNSNSCDTRYLPEFTSNMGHLGYLTSYISYYSQFDPNREIVIWPKFSPNEFFMNLVLEQSPIKIKTIDDANKINAIPFYEKDNLALSMCEPGKWRVEHCSGAFSYQDFPEMIEDNAFKIKFPDSLQEYNISKLVKIGFNPNKWFVILHIRENKDISLNNQQARDARISNYKYFCEKIYELGGQVIRMGNKNFPSIPEGFLAIDYAQTDVRSGEIDCWLWANCRWWTGNANGASLAAYAFGAKRLISDQWFWDNLGPSTDFYMPKIMSVSGKILDPNQTINFDLSRRMAVDDFTKLEACLIDNTPTQLRDAAVDLFLATEINKQSRTRNQNSRQPELQNNLNSRSLSSKSEQSMQIPTSYINYLVDDLGFSTDWMKKPPFLLQE
jgi:putative glycosyltransferase (TIGR04372 family)